jgi:copper oxidase (laccase) domain-containing protein
LYDPITPAIGLVHAGWRSSREDIASKAVRMMQAGCNTQPQNLYAAFGPVIRDCCYEVSADFENFFPAALARRNKRYYLDLSGINKEQLLDAGLRAEHIFDSGICTCCQNNRFSLNCRVPDLPSHL